MRKKINAFIISLNILIFNTQMIFASGGISGEEVKTGGFLAVWSAVMGLLTAAATTSLAACILQYITASDPRAASQAKENAKTVVIAWGVGMLLGSVIIKGFFAFISDFNV